MARADNVFRLRGETSYSQAVEAGSLVHVSGTVSWNDSFEIVGQDDFRKQVATIYGDIGRTMDALGLDAFDLVKETVFTTNIAALIAANDLRVAWFGDAAPPASTWVEIERLANAKLLVEIEVIAARD